MKPSSSPDRPPLSPLLLALLWLAAFLPRLVLAVIFFKQPIALDDMYQYDMLARSIQAGNGYRWYRAEDFQTLSAYYDQFMDVDEVELPQQGLKTAFRAPGYPLFLSGIYTLVPEEQRIGWARIGQSAFTALLAPLAALLALAYGFDRKTSLLSGAAMSIYPLLVFYPLGLASENAFIPLFAAGTLGLLLVRRRRLYPPMLASALLLGFSTLTRSVAVLSLPLGAGWLWIQRKVKPWQVMAFFCLALGLCMPWAVRNSLFMDKPTFLQANLGYNLFVSYHPQGNGGFVSEIAVKPLKYLDDQARERYTTRKAIHFIREDPGRALQRVLRKTIFFFGLEDREMIFFYGNGFFGSIPQPWLLFLYLILVLPWISILFLAPAGMTLAQDRASMYLIAGMVFFYALPHILILAEPRFHLALVPLLIPYTVHSWRNRTRALRLLSRPWQRYTNVILLCIWLCAILVISWHVSWHWETLVKIMGPEGHALHPSY